jgi:predicted Zn-dependent peptidase
MAGDGGTKLGHGFVRASGGGVVTWDDDGGGAAALGIFVRVGSRDEQPDEWGIAHLLEHMAFRGAGPWNAKALADRMDRLGADINAYTTRDVTCYHAHVLEDDLPAAWSLLAAMVADPWLAEDELDRERGVVLDELREAGDDAEDRAEQAYVEALWGSHAIAHEVLGTPGTLASLTATGLRAFHRQHYRRSAVTVVLVGRGASALVPEVERWMAELPAGDPLRRQAPRPEGGAAHVVVPGEEAYVTVGVPAPALGTPEETAYRLLALIFGGQNSSRLWQRVREELGLAYQVSAAYTPAADYGDFTVSAGVAAGQIRQLLAELGQEWRRLAKLPVSDDELARARLQAARGVVFGRETPEGRMHYLAHFATRGVEPPPPDTLLAAIAGTPLTAVREAAERVVASLDKRWACGLAAPKSAVKGSPARWLAEALAWPAPRERATGVKTGRRRVAGE